MDFLEGVVALESTPASEKIELFGDQVRELLHPTATEDAKLVQKGLMLYRQGLVKQLQIWDEKITATVQDVMPCYVTLNFEFLSMSKCSCPGDDFCRHQMAVFFAAYARVGSVSDWVTDWREPIRESKAVSGW